ncbi:MAG TPA: OmpH family outer membrane protein [Candidatus Kapabacteria bacterium]|nr:OmpH family outer membrane protein [Candidatus Kapabacteria bacterium]HRT67328.1 OmpH family outer membrane protein [Bacteroidota bacterium]
MNKKLIKILSIFVFALLLKIPANAQQSQAPQPLKVGVVDLEIILKEMPEAVEADKKLNDIGKKWQDSLLAMKKDLDDKLSQYQKRRSVMTVDQQQKEEESLQQMNLQLLQYQEQKFGQTGELSNAREQYLAPIREKILKSIKQVSKDEKINLVFDKTSQALLYYDEKLDITYKVLDVIKRGTN